MTDGRKIRPKFYWAHGKDLRESGMAEMIAAEGWDALRFEFHPGRDKPWVLVSEETGEPCGEYNITHTCPPDCP